jgi:serine/threonine protein kinase
MESAGSVTNFAGDRTEIGGYRVLRPLSPEQSWLCVASGERMMVLKTLDEDCLWKGQLHPNIRDRLARVRELAHSGVANLYGVERDADLIYMAWEYVEGDTLEERARSSRCGRRDFMVLARELVLGVEMLHARGIVHGALKGSNVIVDGDDRLVMTHVSPLLYCDPADDTRMLMGLLLDLLDERGEAESPLGRLLKEEEGDEVSLRRLAARIGALIESRETGESLERGQGRAIRKRSLVGAGMTAVVAVGLFMALRHYGDARTPKPPTPPEAAPAAMKTPTGESASASLDEWSRRAAP